MLREKLKQKLDKLNEDQLKKIAEPICLHRVKPFAMSSPDLPLKAPAQIQ
jgi:hypothetical protein